METANVCGRRVLCVRVGTGLTTRLDAVTFRDRAEANRAAADLTANGTACEPVKMGRTIYLEAKGA